MREFYRRHRGLHRWLLAVVALLAVYFALRPVPGLMNWLSRHVIMPWERAGASVCYLFRTSMAEVAYIVLLSVGIFYVANVLRRLVTQPHRGRTLYRFFLTVVCSGLSIYAGFCLLWGVNYYADSFQQQSGIYARSCTVEELEAVTTDFARQLAQAAEEVQRDENGCFAVSRQEIFAAATSVYAPSYEEFPCLRMKDHTPKAISCSTALSAMDFTGFYFPFTGEANLNVDCPASFLPSTIVHEMAHQRGIASEQECNFIAIAVSLASGDPVYRYSGLLMGYVHLGNALYRADPDRWQAIRDTLPDTVVADLRQNSAYWAAFEGPVNDAASRVYDSFLKSNGESRGVQSYGTVVDMLMAYYGSVRLREEELQIPQQRKNRPRPMDGACPALS